MRLKLRTFLKFSFVFTIAIVVISCAGNGDNVTMNPPPTGNTSVMVGDNFFNPVKLTVRVGTTVVWLQQGTSVHTVTSGSPSSITGLFDSPILNPGQNFTFMFSQTGSFPYFCRVHGAMMSGTIVVQQQ